jgi:hypothetical protein
MMADPTAEFFEELRARGHDPLVEDATATVRFDVARGKHTDRWLLRIRKGDLGVSTGDGEADCVISADRTVFDGIVTGTVNTLAALLRGELVVDGDPDLLVLVQRLFPGPPQARDRKPAGAEGGRRS